MRGPTPEFGATAECVLWVTHPHIFRTNFDWNQYEFDASLGFPGEGPVCEPIETNRLGEALRNVRHSLDVEERRYATEIFHESSRESR